MAENEVLEASSPQLQTQFACSFPPIHNALESRRGRDGMEVKFSIPQSEIGAGMRLYLMRDKAVSVLAEIVSDKEPNPDLRAAFLAVVSLIQSPGTSDGLEAKLWVPEVQLPNALPLHLLRGRPLWVTIEVLDDECLFADAKTKKRHEREKAQTAAISRLAGNDEAHNPEGDNPTTPTGTPSEHRAPKRRARPGRIERGGAGL